MTHEEQRADFIRAIRAMADFIEQHEEIKGNNYVQLNIPCITKDGLAQIAKSCAPLKKVYSESFVTLRKEFSDDVIIDWYVQREAVCRKVLKSTRTVTLPAQEAMPERVEQIEEWEWECPDSLLRPEESHETTPAMA